MMWLNSEEFAHLCAPNSVEMNFNFYQNPMMLHILPPNFYRPQIFPRFLGDNSPDLHSFLLQKNCLFPLICLVSIDATGFSIKFWISIYLLSC